MKKKPSKKKHPQKPIPRKPAKKSPPRKKLPRKPARKPLPKKLAVVFSSLGPAGASLYDDTQGAGVNGGGGPGPGFAVAAGFTPARNFKLRQIDVAFLTSNWPADPANTPSFRVGLYPDAGGKPAAGSIFSAAGFTTVSACCGLQSWTFPGTSVGGVTLGAGQMYWITAEPTTNSDIITWAGSNQGATGPLIDGSWDEFASPQTTWTPYNGVARGLPAFRVLGDPA